MNIHFINGISLDELEHRMQPGGWYHEEFLKQEQSLISVIATDAAYIRKIGVTAQEIANSIDYLLKRGKQGNRFKPARVEHFLVRIIRTHKMLTCPWAKKQFDWCHFGQGVKYLTTEDFEITNTRLGEHLVGTTLCLHLIRDHNFFGGPGTKYRIDPERAVHVLELLCNINSK